ncbi:A24 family peptidase [Neobacillus sp. C211]|uniref:A24 family peptidase n=1 Tax=unclassified Neobacillus TaxID=2675272 RepID=UPI003977F6C2
MIIYLILGIALVISLITDLKERKILNLVTVPTIFFGLIYYSITQGLNGLLFSFVGLLVGLGVLIIPFLLGGMGAGDVKLMGAIGALMGASFVFYSFIYTALFGGVIALMLIIKKKGFQNSIRSIFFNVIFYRSNLGSMNITKDKEGSISFPYGVPIALGTLCSLLWGGFK